MIATHGSEAGSGADLYGFVCDFECLCACCACVCACLFVCPARPVAGRVRFLIETGTVSYPIHVYSVSNAYSHVSISKFRTTIMIGIPTCI